MKRSGYILLMLATLALSCTREPLPGHDPSENGVKTIHYKVQVSSIDESKATTADNNTKYVFQASDALYVSSTDPGTGDEQLFGVLTLVNGSGSTLAYFEGDLVGVNEFEPASDTPINVTLVSAGDRIHTTGGGKLTDTSYPANEYAADLAEAVQKFSDFTCSTTFGATSFTLSQQSAFIIFKLRLNAVDTPADTDIDITFNDGSNDIWASTVTVTQAGRLNFVAAFPGGRSLADNAELSLSWTGPLSEPQTKSFGDFTASTLTANHYYTVSRSEFNYFRIKAIQSSTTITFNYNYADSGIEYSTDEGLTWTHYSDPVTLVNAGDELYVKGNRSNYKNDSGDSYGTPGIKPIFEANKKCYIAGNIMSLLQNGELSVSAFQGAFSKGSSTAVTYIDIDPDDPLILPATALAEKCYMQMFRNCTSLQYAPSFTVESVSVRSCYNMFRQCSSLKNADNIKLNAMTLATDCYRELFRQCSALTSAPMLPAPTLVQECYRQMFSNCTSLLSVTCLATDISAPDCTTDWMSVVTNNNTRTFYKAEGYESWTRGASGIPNNWTIRDYSPQTP